MRRGVFASLGALYALDPESGQATFVATLVAAGTTTPITLQGTRFGFDFKPRRRRTPDRQRHGPEPARSAVEQGGRAGWDDVHRRDAERRRNDGHGHQRRRLHEQRQRRGDRERRSMTSTRASTGSRSRTPRTPRRSSGSAASASTPRAPSASTSAPSAPRTSPTPRSRIGTATGRRSRRSTRSTSPRARRPRSARSADRRR